MEKKGAPRSARSRESDLPFREELLPAEQLDVLARAEAATSVAPGPTRLLSPLAPIISRARKGLTATSRFLANAVRQGAPVSPAIEWLLDNDYLVEEQIRSAADLLPAGLGAALPRLAEGADAGQLRIWRVAVVLLAHTDSRVEEPDVERFVAAYQEVAPLTMAEVWALPVVLRIALADNVRRLSKRVIDTLEAERAAGAWAERIFAAMEAGRPELDTALAELDTRIARGAVGAQFLLRLVLRLTASERDVGTIITRIERSFDATGVSARAARSVAQTQAAADQVSIANAVTSIRAVEATDWRAFFERTNAVEHALRTDPAGVYADMDFASRDRYRHAIEVLARRAALPEIDVARAAVSRATKALTADGDDLVRGHVGWYLVGEGSGAFLDVLRGRAPIWPSLDTRRSRGGRWYAAMLAGGMLALTAWLADYAAATGANGWAVEAFALLGVVPISGLVIDVVGRVAAALWPPQLLPKLDTRRPIGPAHRTLVVVPALLTSPESAAAVVHHLEVQMIANRDDDIHFALLADLKAAATQHTPLDAAIREAALDELAALNARHGDGVLGPFHLMMRERRYDEVDGVWMGWERKRGALTELGRLLRGATDTSLTTLAGDAGFLADVTFVITLDVDTVLPADAARALVSTIAHPLNRAHVDRERRVVTRGYGLVQPHIGMQLPSAIATRYAALNTGPTGIDPYVGAVSDTYQDVFGEGSFTGKGIFEVDVFNTVLDGRIPPRTLLSHDLLEGSFLRTALASDVQLFDDFPPDYRTQCSRLHRWTRGDWQTTPWLRRFVRGEGGERYRNPLSGLHGWKIVDNLRRSLQPAALLAWGLAGWLLLPRPGMLWVPLLVGVISYPAVLHALDTALGMFAGASPAALLRPLLRDLRDDLERAVLALAFLPHQALLRLDAALRACWRMHVSHRRMLEWTTAAEALANGENRLGLYVRLMGPAALLATAAAVAVGVASPLAAAFLAPVCLLWLASPVIAWRISQPAPTQEQGLPTGREIEEMRAIARRTWEFFETFVGPADNWLPPDNFQEDPAGVIAHRTSPTNMGLALLANLTAHDLGYLSLSGLVERTEHTLGSMRTLERHHGHFFNWYDTEARVPLRPHYISTVDSGNLAGALITLRVGLRDALDAPLLGPAVLSGIADSVRLAIDELAVEPTSEGAAALRRNLDDLARRAELAEMPATLPEWHALLAALDDEAASLVRQASERTGDDSGATRAAKRAAEAVRRHADDLAAYCPWAGDPSLTRVPDVHTALGPFLDHVPSLREIASASSTALAALGRADAQGDADAVAWAASLATHVRAGARESERLSRRIGALVGAAGELWDELDLSLVYDASRELFSIGFNAEQGRCDSSSYDMLASECRLTSFLAVARGDAPVEHWFRLGRLLTRAGGGFALLSWSASMFEYLMPLLLMRSWPGTLLDGTYHAVVRRQIQYGAERGVPWGVSESAFNSRDAELTYQYQAFGVPGLGLKRGLSEDVVVAPYATMLAAQVDRAAALSNLERLAHDGALGSFGFYEAIDYTPGRIEAGQRRSVVKTYMAHHQGMAFVALGNEITDAAMQRRFHADPLVASAELLLQERVPHIVQPTAPHVEEVEFVRARRELPLPVTRSYATPDTPAPATHFLSNGRYSVMVTNAGGGYSRASSLAVTRYREDLARDCWGQFIFIRDANSGRVWSATHQPVCAPADDYHCILSAARAEYHRRDGDIDTYTEITVSPESDAEVRRVAITNHGHTPAYLDVTSYFEIALAPQGADQAHRAFSNLFVETEWVPDARSILFTRRPRSSEEPRLWGVHTLACDAPEPRPASVETDRARFIGRGRQIGDAVAAHSPGPLSGTVGAVLDPICAIRRPIFVGPGETVRLAFSTGVASTREQALAMAQTYHDIRSVQRALDLAWGTSEIELRDLGIEPPDAVLFQRLASRLLLTDPYSPLKLKTRRENRLPVSGLWGIGISGDHPILLVRVERLEDTPFVRQMLLAHQYWRHQGFRVDLVILNRKPSAYRSELDDRLHMLVRTGRALQMVDRPGGVFLRQEDQIDPDVLVLLESVARATLDADAGSLRAQLDRHGERPTLPAPLRPTRPPRALPSVQSARPALDLDNGYGGIDPATGEYVIVLEHGENTPAPWINVMATPEFGTMVSEAGVGCTWALNSHENRLTTWNNDAVIDGTGELLYVRDEETGEVWSPTPLPVRDDGTYVIRHGRGQSSFEHATHGIAHRLEWFVAANDPVRVAALTLTNLGEQTRNLSVTHLVEWVLGDSRSRASQRVVTSYDTAGRMLVAHSFYNEDFPGQVAFLACDRKVHSYTGDRTEFLGRNGTPAAPAALTRTGLGGLTGRFHDTCGALMSVLAVPPGDSVTIRFLLGQCPTIEEARRIVERHRAPEAVDRELERIKTRWAEVLDTLTVTTPDPVFDAMANGRALYQALACRIWGRTALYQSSGAFGFRDQLQDVVALTLARPDITRGQIVEASRRQFVEGDVLHWWQPHSGRGVRTRFSDDRLWLPFVTADYVESTGDASVLDERTPFLAGPAVPPDREDLYLVPQTSTQDASVYEHCVQAFEASRGTGAHGLPLIGGGDWNDGMNRIGHEGRGESVWLAWFLITTLRRFAPICEARGDDERAADYRNWADALVVAVEREGWDGAWYRRAFFDDGTPLGTQKAQECRIDAIAQAWAVLSGAASPDRARSALGAVDEKLVRWEDRLIALLAPPFDHMTHDPGYIKGYVPGVRENGGQYTHGALWVVAAHALLGDGDEAVELLDLINPLSHARTREDADTYRVEPYAVVADVYAVPPHVGRGGWSWYTGSAALFHTTAIRSILGIRTVGDGAGGRVLLVDPTIPKAWPGFEATLRLGGTTWHIRVDNPRGANRGVERITLDGAPVEDRRVPLTMDGQTHEVVVAMLGA